MPQNRVSDTITNVVLNTINGVVEGTLGGALVVKSMDPCNLGFWLQTNPWEQTWKT